jgi:Tol biopolymer transport system component/imidazolonepropionase-like amidohydrolase
MVLLIVAGALLAGAALPADAIAVGAIGDARPLSLAASRKIEFRTDEGTWISLDVSPEGRRIVFDLLGDVYALDARGGEAKALLVGPPFDSQPVYSPDGRRIAFLSDRSGSENLWIADADGSGPQQLSWDLDNTSFASPAWAPDGRYVYVSRSEKPNVGVFNIWVYPVQGGAGLRLDRARSVGLGGSAEGHNALGPTPSPDGRHLYFSSRQGAFAYNELPNWSITRHDLSSGEEEIVVAVPQGSAMKPVLSPDGRQLVYATRRDGQTGLRLRDLGNGRDRWLAFPVQRDAQQDIMPSRDLLPSFAFTPDGTALILALEGRIQRLDVASGESSIIPFVADVSLDVGPKLEADQRIPDGPVRARLIQAPRQSPDGKRLAFSAFSMLHVMDLPDGEPRRLTDSPEAQFQPSWSPDGRSIVYVTWSAAAGGHVWKVAARGGEPVRLSRDAAFYTDPIHAPDGQSVFALRSSHHDRMGAESELASVRHADIVRMSRPGADPALVSRQRGIRNLHFSRDPQRIYFHRGDGSVESIRTDGSAPRVHVRIRGADSKTLEPLGAAVRNAAISPDGQWVLATFGFAPQLYLVAVPPGSGAMLEVDLDAPRVPMRRVTAIGADHFAWADGGETISWSLGATFHRQSLAGMRFGEPNGARDDGQASMEAFSARLEVPRDTPRGAIVLRGGAAITMRGDEVVNDADIVVVGNRIVALGRRGEVAIPPRALIRDVSGRYVIPGLVDTHAHWYEIRHEVLDLQNWSFIINLAYGVTAGLDPQSYTSDMFAYADMIDAGRMTGPRVFSAGPGLMADTRIATAADAVAVARRYRDHYGTRNLKSYYLGNRRQRQLLIGAARELGMMPTTEGHGDLELGLTFAMDGFSAHEHSLPTVPLYKDVIELFARTKIGYNITSTSAYGGIESANYFLTRHPPHGDAKLGRFMPHFVNDSRTARTSWFSGEQHHFPQIAREAARIVRAGGRVGIGSHGSDFQGLAYHWELQAHAAGGWSPMEILRAATLHGAQIIGRASDLGSLEPGKLADLVILEKDPLVDIANTSRIEFVMKNGRLYAGETLDEIWPRHRPMVPAWFESERPSAAQP